MLEKYDGKRVHIVTVNGKIYDGVVGDYVDPEDNEPNEEAVILDIPRYPYPIQFNASEIKTIEEV